MCAAISQQREIDSRASDDRSNLLNSEDDRHNDSSRKRGDREILQVTHSHSPRVGEKEKGRVSGT
jgi:hypothetical protein